MDRSLLGRNTSISRVGTVLSAKSATLKSTCAISRMARLDVPKAAGLAASSVARYRLSEKDFPVLDE